MYPKDYFPREDHEEDFSPFGIESRPPGQTAEWAREVQKLNDSLKKKPAAIKDKL